MNADKEMVSLKRLLYIAFTDLANLHFGVNAKVLSQCRAFSEYGYEVTLIGRNGPGTVVMKHGDTMEYISRYNGKIKNARLQSLRGKQRQYADIRRYIQGKQFDACYIRYDFSDPGFIGLLKELQKCCKKIALELPTYPYEQENQFDVLSRLKIWVDRLFRTKLHRYIDFIVTFYAGYEKLFGIPVLVIPNGFDFSTFALAEQEPPQDGIHIIAVSSMREWHGYERIIEGMKAYYQELGSEGRNVILHLVGNGREYGKYKSLVEKDGLQAHVIMEGALHGEALDALYEKCAMGLDSLARHRSGIDVLSSLKSREYGAKGLAIINSCKIDIIDDDFPYLLRVPADETPVNMKDVISFYDRCFARGKSRQEIGREIRSYVEARSGMKQTLADVVALFDETVRETV